MKQFKMPQLLSSQPILDQFWQNFQPSHPAKLGIILVGDNPDSEKYVELKQQEAKKYGIETELICLQSTCPQSEIYEFIDYFNNRKAISGIIIQLPLPKNWERDKILQTINPAKDVDNLTGKSQFISPMVQGVQALIDIYKLDLEDPIVVIGAGPLVGRPIRQWLESEGRNPIVVDKDTPNADEIVRNATILFCGAGRQVILKDDVNENQIIFDCSGRDVDFEAVKDKVKAISPPKGSVGPLTVHFLLLNTLLATKK